MPGEHDRKEYLVDGRYCIQDLVDLERLEAILERFTDATGFTIGFLDHPDLNILIATGWRDICTKFHRVCPESERICTTSNHHLLDQLDEPGKVVIEPCDNGLVDCATPIIIKGRHVASLATGQLLLDEPDPERFLRQAEVYGYDSEAYMKALSEVPVVSAEKLRSVTAFLGDMAVIISELGYTNLLVKEEAEALEREIFERRAAEAERERLRAQLAHAQKMESIGRLAGGVAHDFNNMLSVILGHTEILLQRMPESDPLREDVQEILEASEHSSELTQQLLAFARKQVVDPKLVDLNEIVSDMLKMISRLIGEDVELDWRPGDGLWPLRIDPGQIDQVLANLCVNAKDAIEGAGRIRIRTENLRLEGLDDEDHPVLDPGCYVLLEVGDDGRGIDPEVIQHIFEPFYTTKESGRGTGLGLATVYGIVKQNDGYVDVRSEPGRGALFRLYFARAHGRIEPKVAETPAEPSTRVDATVLLVEDEGSVLSIVRTILEQMGCSVLSALTPGEALKLAERHAGEIDLLITDIVMPEMNGRRLAERVRAHMPGLKCLLMSGYSSEVVSSPNDLGHDTAFIQKPFRMNDLATKVASLLDRN